MKSARENGIQENIVEANQNQSEIPIQLQLRDQPNQKQETKIQIEYFIHTTKPP